MATYGAPAFNVSNDSTDRIGIRTLALSKLWQPKSWTAATVDPQLDPNFPTPPTVSGGVRLIGQETRREGGGCRTFWTFEGVNGDGRSVTFKGRTNSLDFQFDPGFSQVSIQLHPKFQQLLATYNGSPTGDSVLWPQMLTSDSSSSMEVSAQAGQTNPMFGVQDYLRMEGTYSFRYASFTPPANAGVATILESGSLPGVAPTISGRNWLQAPSPFKRRGPVYDITEIYWLSGAGGWPEPIYGSGAGSGGGSGDFSIDAANNFGFTGPNTPLYGPLFRMNGTPPLSIFDDPRSRQGVPIPRPGKGISSSVNMMGAGFGVRSNPQVFNHPWKPAMAGGVITLQRGQVTMAAASYEPTINDVPISGPPPTPPPALYLDPSVPAGGTESWVCLQLDLEAVTPANTKLPAALANDKKPTIVHLLNPVSQQAALALFPLVLITWRSGQPFQAIEGCYFNLVYTRVIPGPGGGPVQHFFT